MEAFMKKLISFSLSLIFVITCCLTAGSIAVSAETGYDRGYNQGMAGTGKIVAEGLDISEHQEGIKLQDIKNAGFDYVILRAGVKLDAGSNRKDYQFETFYSQARAAGLDIGAYYFSQAKNATEAKAEANCFLEYIKGKKFEYPLYLDFESSAVKEAIGSNATKAAEICYAFMDTMRDAGYLVGLYGNAGWFDPGYNSNWMASKLDNDIGKKYEFWMANYFNNMLPENTKTANYKNKYGMYQYTSSKTISGWGKDLDHNVCYKDYPSIVRKYGFNGYAPNTPDPVIETEAATEKPTQKPTQNQTQKPTQNQTQKPTQNQTQKPTQNQTQKLTDAATLSTSYASQSASESYSGYAENNAGCGASIGGAIVLTAICGVGGAALVLKKKRED